jgi:thioesterase domain-containing protein
MASHYLKEIRELQSEGPYYLGGFCMGGSVAYEMAQQLREQNQEVRLLVMFDTYNHNGTAPQMSFRNRLRYFLQKVQFHWANVARLSSKERIAYLGEKLRFASKRELGDMSVRLENLSKLYGKRVAKANVGIVLEDVNDQAGHSYRPKAYPGNISLFVPQRNYSFMGKPSMGWTEFATGGVKVLELPVDPGGMFLEPYVQTLADKLRACIDDAEKARVAPR